MPLYSSNIVAYDDGAYCKVDNVSLNATVNDADNDSISVGFFWGNYTTGNYTLLASFYNVSNGTSLSVYLPDCWHRQIIVNNIEYNVTWLEHSHRYEWFCYGDDGKNATLIQNNFDTCNAYDLNMDRHIDYLDISLLVTHYGEQVSLPGASPWDINEDTYVNYADVSSLISHIQ